MVRMMPKMTGSSVTFPLNRSGFTSLIFKPHVLSAACFKVFFKEDSLGLYGIELIVVGSADATPFREHLRRSIKSMFYLFINHIHSVPEYKVAFSPWVLLYSTHIC